MSKEKVMKSLRERWMEKDYDGFNRLYLMSKWMFTPEEVLKMAKAMRAIGPLKDLTEAQRDLIEHTLDVLDGKLVEVSNE